MKLAILISLIVFSFSACSKEKKKPVIEEEKKVEAAKAVPCDSKEDILKKLEEKKKAESEKGKGFSLQGGNDTGCKVK